MIFCCFRCFCTCCLLTLGLTRVHHVLLSFLWIHYLPGLPVPDRSTVRTLFLCHTGCGCLVKGCILTFVDRIEVYTVTVVQISLWELEETDRMKVVSLLSLVQFSGPRTRKKFAPTSFKPCLLANSIAFHLTRSLGFDLRSGAPAGKVNPEAGSSKRRNAKWSQ